MLTPGHARAILRTCQAEDADFHALSSATVEHLLIHADAHKYRKPKHLIGWSCRACGRDRGKLFWRPAGR